VENSVVTGNGLLDRHVFSVAIVHVARGEAWKEEVPGQLGILAEITNLINTHKYTNLILSYLLSHWMMVTALHSTSHHLPSVHTKKIEQ
jgi:hypothetical protein